MKWLLQAGTSQRQHTSAGQPPAVQPPAIGLIIPEGSPDIVKRRGAVLARLMKTADSNK